MEVHVAHPQSGDTVKIHYTGRLEDGRVFDSSKERNPVELKMGEGQLLPGFEEALTQMEPGDERTITIPAERAYGPHRPELMLSVDRSELPDHITPEVGQHLQIPQDDGRVAVVRITQVSDELVTLDVNHPLAGQNLTFELELVEVGVRR
jgi:peptidylprolyl isomerase